MKWGQAWIQATENFILILFLDPKTIKGFRSVFREKNVPWKFSEQLHFVKNVQTWSFFWSVFSLIWSKYRDYSIISVIYCKVQTREKKTRKKLKLEHFSYKVIFQNNFDNLRKTELILHHYLLVVNLSSNLAASQNIK